MRPLLALLLSATACGGNRPPAVAPAIEPDAEELPAATCETAVDKSIEINLAIVQDPKLPLDVVAADHERTKSLREPMLSACTDDAWSESALACMTTASTAAQIDECSVLLTPAQIEGIGRRVQQALGT